MLRMIKINKISHNALGETNRSECCFLCLVSVVVKGSEIITGLDVVTTPAKHVLSAHTLPSLWRTTTDREGD